ncbi:MAG: hypothetical protein IPL61_25565 [Myxococcales bacterium]|nr:hypothetical protein [Myxococcales bacterium]
MATRSGRLVVAVVLVIGVGLGALGSWWLVRSRPVPGPFIDAIALPDGGAVVIRHEQGTSRDFVEVHGRDHLRWRALIPPYAGSIGTVAVAATNKVVTVRVLRDGHAHVFAFDIVHGSKIASFDLTELAPADPRGYTVPGLATVSAGAWAVEIVAQPEGGVRLFTMELDEHRLAWKVELPTVPSAVWFGDGGQVRARLGDEVVAWNLTDGKPEAPASLDAPATGSPAGGYVTADGFGWSGGGKTDFAVPAGAVPPQAYHLGSGRAWVIEPERLSLVDGPLGVTRVIRR